MAAAEVHAERVRSVPRRREEQARPLRVFRQQAAEADGARPGRLIRRRTEQARQKDVDAAMQRVLLEIGADHPRDGLIERRGQADLLRELLEVLEPVVVEHGERAIVGIEPVLLVVLDERRVRRQGQVADLPIDGSEHDVGLEVAVLGEVVLRDLVEPIRNVADRRRVAPVVRAAGRGTARGIERIDGSADVHRAARAALAVEHVQVRAVDDGIERARRGQPRCDRRIGRAETRPRFADGVLACRAALPDVLVLVLEREVEIVGGVPRRYDARRSVLFYALRHVADDRRIAGVVELVIPPRETNAEVVRQRPACSEVDGALLVAAIGHVHAAFPRFAGPARDDVDRARGRALAGKGRLRTAHDFDPLQIEHGALAQVVAAVVNAVRECGDGLLERLVAGRRADTAHDQRLAGECIAHEQVGHEDREVLDVGETALLYHFASDGGDGDRDVLQALLSALRRDEYFFEAFALRE